MNGTVDAGRLSTAVRGLCGAGVMPGACVAGIVTLSLGVICAVDAFVVPGLFGPVAAVVVAAERLLCAARSASGRSATVWTGVAFAWLAVASAMLHTPMVSGQLLQWLVVLPIAASAACRLGSLSGSRAAVLWVVAAGVTAQLAMLFGAASAPLARVAAAAAFELVLIGVVRLLHSARPASEAYKSGAGSAQIFSATPNRAAGINELDPGLA